MPFRIEVGIKPESMDVAGGSIKSNLKNFLGLEVENVRTLNVFLLDLGLSQDEAESVRKEILTDNVLQNSSLNKHDTGKFDYCIEIGFKPGVTDNLGTTAKEAVQDLLKKRFDHGQKVYSAKQYRVSAARVSFDQIKKASEEFLANDLIESIKLYTYDEWNNSETDIVLPKIDVAKDYTVKMIDLNLSNEDLVNLSKSMILSLSLEEMLALKDYFNDPKIIAQRKEFGLDHKLADVELECLAQTWSEHCKHKIFNCNIDYYENGKKEEIKSLFKSYIMESTKVLTKTSPWLLSVFKDNAGVIEFNKNLSIVYKVETHNSPSALEPYGGAITGIVGVNRDPMGTGMGAELLYNVWGYCFGSPFYDKPMPKELLHPNRIREYVHKGVIDGGNQSGIPYARGWEYFDERYIGKPLVFCGTVGVMPRKLNGAESHDKKITPGDLIVMAGGRIGKDGIHGATFSSEELHKDSPVQAVQIGDPITQKKMYDFIMEARDRGLYSFITDNGAGGLSSSIGEMAESSGGCRLDLTNAPLKYNGLDPWEILISEAQERMSMAVPEGKRQELFDFAAERDVELTVIGEFTDSQKFHVVYNDQTVAYIDMEFLHDGIPQMHLDAVWELPKYEEPTIDPNIDLSKAVTKLLARLNITSNEGKARQYDHEVKGLSVIKPFVGVNRDIPSDATVLNVEYGSKEGIILSEGKNPSYSDIDTYHMTAAIIDETLRKILSSGGTLDRVAGLDNFCWPDPVYSEKTPDGKYKLAQLVRSNKALYDYTIAFGVPLISGKDSMKNDCIFDGKKISIPPTLLFSAIGKVDDITKCVTLDSKLPGDLVYVVGETRKELGGSEYFRMLGEDKNGDGFVGNNVPKVDIDEALRLYKAIEKVTQAELAHSIHAPSIGGLAIGFAKTAMAGVQGMEIDITKIPNTCDNDAEVMFSESCCRFIVTIPAKNKAAFEELLGNIPYSEIGVVTEAPKLKLKDKSGKTATLVVEEMTASWKNTLKDNFDGNS